MPKIKYAKVPGLPGWSVSPVLPPGRDEWEPVESDDPAFMIFYGMGDNPGGDRLYRIPANTPVSEVVKVFKVGLHGAESYGYDPVETVHLVAENVDKVAALVPCRVLFATTSSLGLKFSRPVKNAEFKALEALFPMDMAMQLGLDGYISDWSGKGSLLAPVKKNNLLHLWWD